MIRVTPIPDETIPCTPARLGLSIETYRFEENGDVEIRTYYKVPRHSDAEMGELFQTYLPENG